MTRRKPQPTEDIPVSINTKRDIINYVVKKKTKRFRFINNR